MELSCDTATPAPPPLGGAHGVAVFATVRHLGRDGDARVSQWRAGKSVTPGDRLAGRSRGWSPSFGTTLPGVVPCYASTMPREAPKAGPRGRV